jgi:hypothetical protein
VTPQRGWIVSSPYNHDQGAASATGRGQGAASVLNRDTARGRILLGAVSPFLLARRSATCLAEVANLVGPVHKSLGSDNRDSELAGFIVHKDSPARKRRVAEERGGQYSATGLVENIDAWAAQKW